MLFVQCDDMVDALATIVPISRSAKQFCPGEPKPRSAFPAVSYRRSPSAFRIRSFNFQSPFRHVLLLGHALIGY